MKIKTLPFFDTKKPDSTSAHEFLTVSLMWFNTEHQTANDSMGRSRKLVRWASWANSWIQKPGWRWCPKSWLWLACNNREKESSLVPFKRMESQFLAVQSRKMLSCISWIVTYGTSKEFKANQLHSLAKSQMLVGIIGFQVFSSVIILTSTKPARILFIRLLIVDSIMLAFSSQFSIVSRTVSITLKATSGILHHFTSHLSLQHPSCPILSDSCWKSPELFFAPRKDTTIINNPKPAHAWLETSKESPPARHLLSKGIVWVSWFLSVWKNPRTANHGRKGQSSNKPINKVCLVWSPCFCLHRREDNPKRDFTCIDHWSYWKMRCRRGAWMTLWLLAQVVPASSSLLHASATCTSCFHKKCLSVLGKNRHVTMRRDVSCPGAPAAPLPTHQSE